MKYSQIVIDLKMTPREAGERGLRADSTNDEHPAATRELK